MGSEEEMDMAEDEEISIAKIIVKLELYHNPMRWHSDP
jgi:hypothetical protein